MLGRTIPDLVRHPYRDIAKLVGPSRELAADKAEFGSSRIRRWSDRERSPR